MYFQNTKIPYQKNSHDPLVFKSYNADEEIEFNGVRKKMRDWLRFSVCYWHTYRANGTDPFSGFGTRNESNFYSWEKEGGETIEDAKRRVDAHFEFLELLQVDYFTFHDRDVAPIGKTLEETNENLRIVVDYIEEKMKKTGKKLLWCTSNLFSDPIYMNGASTNSDPRVFIRAAAQVKNCLDIAKRLNAENFVFWGGREGYSTLLNTDMKKELDHMALFFRLAVQYKEKIGFKGQFLIEPKPREPTIHQYDWDSAAVIAFLTNYNLRDHFKLNIEGNHATLAGKTFLHEVSYASTLGFFGSLDANQGESVCGWDLDKFSTDPKEVTQVMQVIINQGGFSTGGLNFDAKLRRESVDLEDLVIGHITAIDCWARGLRKAVQIERDGILNLLKQTRYKSFNEGIGLEISEGKLDFESLEKLAHSTPEPELSSGKQEKYESIFDSYFHN